MVAVAAACILLVPATGCAADPKPAPRSNPPAAAPVFASDEEALAAATEAYEGYVKTADQIVRDGGSDPSRISEYVSDDLAASEVASFASLKDRSLRGVGETSYANFSLQQVSTDPSDKEIVTAYVCSDLSETDVVDDTGESVVDPDRPDRTAFVITFDLSSVDPSALVVSSITVWDGGGVCP